MLYRKGFRLASVIVLGLGLTACASGARVGAMTTGAVQDSIVQQNSKIRQAIELINVSGGEDTNPFFRPEASTADFREALKQSLQTNVLLAPERGRYALDAMIVGIEKPLFGGFDMEVTAKVHYKLTEIGSKAVVFDQEIVTPHTTDFSDALVGPERYRLALEGALHDNIQAFIKALVQKLGR